MTRQRITFEGTCQRCENGLWQGRAGYTCHTCGGTGKVTVALKGSYSLAEHIEKFGQCYGFHVVSAKGNVTKERYRARARLTHELRQFDCGATNSGWYEFECKALAVGTEVGVTGVLHVGGGTECVATAGELHVAIGTGGCTTGKRTTPNGHEVICEVEVIERAAAEAIEKALATG